MVEVAMEGENAKKYLVLSIPLCFTVAQVAIAWPSPPELTTS